MVRAERLGKYELLRHLASGGMARVFLARVDGVGGFARHLVLKTVRPERTEDASYVTMFLDEARLIATLHHQHVAQVYDVGVAEDGTYFLAMEYLHGETVRAILERARDQRERLPLDFSLTVVAAAAAGLHHAHERRGPDGKRLGIVHRDVTPSNVIAGYDGSVKLIDFGIAKAAERSTQTKTGFIKGKAGYMAPEQALGQPVDRRADVFSLGVVLYELTTQTRAFPASSELEVAHRIVRGEVTPPTMAVQGYPPELEDVVMTALARDPDERFGDADAFAYALDRAAQQLGVNPSPVAVSRVMAQLFGMRPEPWLVAEADDLEEHETHTGDTASLLDARPLRVSSGNTSGPSASVVGFARGTDAQRDPRRPRTSSDAPASGNRPRTSSDAPPPGTRAPTVSLRALTPQPVPVPAPAARPAQIVEEDDGEVDEMPTVKFVALDEAEIIIEQPGFGHRVVAPAPGMVETGPGGRRRTPLPGIPAMARPESVAAPTPPVVMPDASPLPVAMPPSPPPMLIPNPPVLPAVAAVFAVPPPKVGKRTEPVTALAELTRPAKRRWLIPLVAAAGAAVVVIVLAIIVLGDDGDTTEPAAPASATAALAAAVPTTTHSLAPVPPPPPRAETSTIQIRVTTTPDDATVMLDGERLGRTPLTLERPRRPGTVALKVRKKGFSTKRIEVDLGADVIYDVELHRSSSDD